MADHITLASGGLAAAREKLIGWVSPVLAKVQRVTQASAFNGSTTAVTVDDSASAVSVAQSDDTVYVQITNLSETTDLYLALANTAASNAVTNVGTAGTRRTIGPGVSWETYTYTGDIALQAASGTVDVDIERHW